MARSTAARRPLQTLVQIMPMATVLLLHAIAVVCAVNVEIINHCSGMMRLFDGGNLTRLKENSTVTFDLPPGCNRAYRYDLSPQATLAEFTIDAQSKTWFDISIIPTGPLSGPKHCKSLAECKTLTGGVGFNKPMQINPKVSYADANCRKLVCLEDGCDDAYQFPQQDEKTHACVPGVDFQVIFCPTPADTQLEWVDVHSALESGVVVGDAVSVRVTSAPTTAPNTEVLTRVSAADDSSAAVYVASALGGTLLVVVVVATVVRYRQRMIANVEYHWPDRKSSDAVSFVSARDML